MIFSAKNIRSKSAKVYDAHGILIGAAFRYDTKTREVSIFLTGRNDKNEPRVLCRLATKQPKTGKSWKALKVKVKIPGSYIIIDGKKY